VGPDPRGAWGAPPPQPAFAAFATLEPAAHIDPDQGGAVLSRVMCCHKPVSVAEVLMPAMDVAKQQTGARVAEAGIALNEVAFDAPWAWLAAGWRDFWAAPSISFAYGALFAGLAALLSVGLWRSGLESLILPLSGGFLLIGPVLAVALYETSRRREAGAEVDLATVTRAAVGKAGQISFFGAILGFIYVVWLQLAFLLFMLFLGTNQVPPAKDFVPMLLFQPFGLGLLVTGTCAGAALAFLVFAISAVSVPLLMTRQVDAVTAMATSVSAVRQNLKPMLLWAGLIAGFMSLGLATLFLGLVLIFPLIGYASWHAFRAVVRETPTSYL
jgi:uncharacterized membrane protein